MRCTDRSLCGSCNECIWCRKRYTDKKYTCVLDPKFVFRFPSLHGWVCRFWHVTDKEKKDNA